MEGKERSLRREREGKRNEKRGTGRGKKGPYRNVGIRKISGTKAAATRVFHNSGLEKKRETPLRRLYQETGAEAKVAPDSTQGMGLLCV